MLKLLMNIHVYYHFIHISVKDEVMCPMCAVKLNKIAWDKSHPLATVQRQITTAKSTAYKNPVPPAQLVFKFIVRLSTVDLQQF